MSALCILLLLAAADPGPTFVLHRADGSDVTGPLQEIGEGWSVVLGGKTETRTKGSDVISLRRAAPLPAPPEQSQLLFPNGDRLAGTPRELARERLTFSVPLTKGQDITVPLATISVLWLADPSGSDDPSLLRRRILAEKRTRDLVALRNGDFLDGTLTGLDKDKMLVEKDGKQLTVERDKVAYVAFNTELMRPLRAKGPYGHLVLTNGSRFSVASAKGDGRSVQVKTLFGATLEVPAEDLATLDLRQGQAVYLSDLKPAMYRHTPWSPALSWPLVADGSVLGHDLHLAGGCHDKGLGMHAGSEVTYALGGAYRRFEALVGLDDRHGREGVVRVKVVVDGKPRDLGRDRDLTLKDGAVPVRLDVTGAKELTLVVERGRSGLWDRQGHVNWAAARLLK